MGSTFASFSIKQRLGLPDDYQAFVPKESWTGPFRLRVPKLGNKLIHKARYPDFEDLQNDFMKKVGRP